MMQIVRDTAAREKGVAQPACESPEDGIAHRAVHTRAVAALFEPELDAARRGKAALEPYKSVRHKSDDVKRLMPTPFASLHADLDLFVDSDLLAPRLGAPLLRCCVLLRRHDERQPHRPTLDI